MKKIIIILSMMIFMGEVIAQNSQQKEENFEYWYNRFITNQNNPYLKGKCEVFVLGDVIWQRYYSEKEYFLSPSFKDFENIKEYYKRITRYDDKERGILKSKTYFVKINLNNRDRTIDLLGKFQITVPDYIKKSILVQLPKIDIDTLIQNQLNIQLVNDYGRNVPSYNITLNQPIETKDIIWEEDWEGSLDPYSRGDNPAYWGDVSCFSCEGSWSMWCADDGNGAPSQNCSEYVNGMDAYIYPTNGIDISGYSDVKFSAEIKWDTEPNYDFLRFWTKFNGTGWYHMWDFSDSSGGCVTDTYDITGLHLVFYWKYTFDSDGTNHNYEGAYLDYMKVEGTPPQPVLILDPTYKAVDWHSGSFTISVSSNVQWNLNESCGWLTCNPTSGQGNITITVNYQQNNNCDPRSCVINVSGGGLSEDCEVYQGGYPPELSVNPTSKDVGWQAGSFTTNVTAECVNWSVSESCNWLYCSPTSGTNDGSFTVNYQENSTSSIRCCTISVIGGGITKTCNFCQDYIDDVEQQYFDNLFNIRPNPTQDRLFIETTSENISVDRLQVIDRFGIIIYQEEDLSILNQKEINVSAYPPGIYLLRIYTQDKVLTRKVVIQH